MYLPPFKVRYYMDYLFGGQTAYNALVAANNAANAAFVAVKAGTLAGQTISVVNEGAVRTKLMIDEQTRLSSIP